MPLIEVPWGSEELQIPIPESWTLLQEARPDLYRASDSWEDSLSAALNRPVSSEPLSRLASARRNGRICLIVEDLTRHSPLEAILRVVLRELKHAGIDESRLELVFATGMHPPLSEAEAREKIGDLADVLQWRSNPWDQPDRYTDLGRVRGVHVRVDKRVVEADLRILISSVSPHLQAGFGGGYKMLLPGCGELSSIRRLHRAGIRRGEPRQMVGTDATRNAMRAMIDRAGALVDAAHGKTFAVQYLLDAQDRPASIATGQCQPAHQMVAKQCAVACGVVPTGLADVLITNAHPRDHDLWQAFKCIPNTCWAARPGGVVICLARCPAGLNEMKTMSWPLSPTWTRRLVRLLGPETICSLMDRLVKHLAGDSQWFIRLASQILERNPIYMVSPQLVADGVQFPGVALFERVEDALDAAGTYLGGDSQRVAVYPSGGASYPVAHASPGRGAE